jgi:periplasmic divalent cation tolerance protein
MSGRMFVYITASSVREAERIGRVLVEEGLAACLNIFPVRSIYRWKGKVEGSAEAVIIAKTRRGLFGRLVERVREIHSYELPCIVGFNIAAGEKRFLEWIDGETGGKRGNPSG